MWARRQLCNYLPPMLTEYAYKAFHDGWVIDGLHAACATIDKMSRCAHAITRHPELEPSLMAESAKRYRFLSETQRAQFLMKLAFVTWTYSNHREELDSCA